MNDVVQTDVVVVGGGVSGLVAARKMMRAGLEVVVLEARDRVGGRTQSVKRAGGALDLGGTWIGPRQTHIKALVDELGLKTHKQHASGRKLLLRDGRLRSYWGPMPLFSPGAMLDIAINNFRIDRFAATIPVESPWLANRAREWDGLTLEQWMADHVRTDSGRFLFGNIARAVLAAEPSQISFLYFLNYIRLGHNVRETAATAGGAQDERLVDGMQSVSLKLAEELGHRVRLGAPVERVDQSESGVVIHSAKGSFSARYAMISVPPNLVDRIQFSTPLPRGRVVASKMPMGSCIKYIATYDRPFWRDRGLSGDAMSDGGTVLTVMDQCTAGAETPALVAFAVGDVAARWALRSPDERRRAVQEELARLFGPEAGEPLTFHEKNWLAEDYSGGCYIAVPRPGDLTAMGDALSAPCGRIHWAGSETATVWQGVDGAVQSGYRAAHEILKRSATEAPHVDQPTLRRGLRQAGRDDVQHPRHPADHGRLHR